MKFLTLMRLVWMWVGILLFMGGHSVLGKEVEDSFKGKVVCLEIGEESLSSSVHFKYIERMIQRAESEGAAAIVLSLNTPGGLAWETSELMMKSLQPAKLPLYAFVDTKAMSAGALIAAACETIYMAPVSSIGAAGLVSSTGTEIEPMMRKKMESAFTAFMRSAVQERGHDVALIAAMMVPKEVDAQYGSVKVAKGELLTLTGKEAVEKRADGKPLLAKGIATSVEDLLKQENIVAPVVKAEPTGFEKIAQWIAIISPILILLGIGGIYFELKTPGFGIGGIVAIVAFGLFFFGNNVAGHLAGYETVGLFVLGLVFLLVEFFLLPGFIIFGLVGGIMILVALFGGMIDPLALERFYNAGEFNEVLLLDLILRPILQLAVGLVGGVVLILVLMKYFGRLTVGSGLTNADMSGGVAPGGAVGVSEKTVLGDVGIATTELKPVGKARFNDHIYEVNCISGIHPLGTAVRVVEIQSFQLMVEAVSDEKRWNQEEKLALEEEKSLE